MEDRVVEVERRVVKHSLIDKRGVQRANCERIGWGIDARDRCAVPVVPLEVSGATGRGPEV